ncbi:putative E3 ubiquitin-protein ligase UBR7 [Protopterus annectens]|uniref:putative E3 ubiquitin-protein ligase UBR7 n=1 Tax=Protopterus annectens TaxID=7888 RepID=UPI001CFAFA65|nr:putative E3 ubiquitin-protein ligase UBR7 [Protopterus annectens]
MAVNKDSLKPSCEDSYSDNTVLSLVDVLEENEQLESDACAVLGASDPERCSYPEGYVKRQALYSCSTCNPRGGEAAGVCLACSYKCHEGHDLFELYTKRNFRCDCGNSKFNGLECKLFKEKEEVNATNKYNHNFFGLYCTCERPYPDPEDDVRVPTVTKVTPLEDSLTDDVDVGDNEPGKNIKQENSASPGQSSHETKSAVPITSIKTDGTTFKEKEGNGDIKGEPCTSTTSCLQSQPQTLVNGDVNCVKKDDTATNSDVQDCLSSCKLHELKAQTVALEKTATYWYQSWRSKLCTCQDCKIMCFQQSHQMHFFLEYNDLKSELKDYLKQFADEGKVVTSEDIQHFFEGLRSRKRRRLDGMQYYCS